MKDQFHGDHGLSLVHFVRYTNLSQHKISITRAVRLQSTVVTDNKVVRVQCVDGSSTRVDKPNGQRIQHTGQVTSTDQSRSEDSMRRTFLRIFASSTLTQFERIHRDLALAQSHVGLMDGNQ